MTITNIMTLVYITLGLIVCVLNVACVREFLRKDESLKRQILLEKCLVIFLALCNIIYPRIGYVCIIFTWICIIVIQEIRLKKAKE